MALLRGWARPPTWGRCHGSYRSTVRSSRNKLHPIDAGVAGGGLKPFVSTRCGRPKYITIPPMVPRQVKRSSKGFPISFTSRIWTPLATSSATSPETSSGPARRLCCDRKSTYEALNGAREREGLTCGELAHRLHCTRHSQSASGSSLRPSSLVKGRTSFWLTSGECPRRAGFS